MIAELRIYNGTLQVRMVGSDQWINVSVIKETTIKMVVPGVIQPY